MTIFKTHSISSAPISAKPLLEKSLQIMGIVPNLHGVLANAPIVLAAYQSLHDFFINTSFDDKELTVIWQTINIEHDCRYCVPAHTFIAQTMQVESALIQALRKQQPMPTAKLQVLRDMTASIVRKRGNVDTDELAAFYAAGYQQQQVLEIILGVSQKLISNYTNRIAKTDLDDVFKPFVWHK